MPSRHLAREKRRVVDMLDKNRVDRLLESGARFQVIFIAPDGSKRPTPLIMIDREQAERLAFKVLIEFGWSVTHKFDKRVENFEIITV